MRGGRGFNTAGFSFFLFTGYWPSLIIPLWEPRFPTGHLPLQVASLMVIMVIFMKISISDYTAPQDNCHALSLPALSPKFLSIPTPLHWLGSEGRTGKASP